MSKYVETFCFNTDILTIIKHEAAITHNKFIVCDFFIDRRSIFIERDCRHFILPVQI